MPRLYPLSGKVKNKVCIFVKTGKTKGWVPPPYYLLKNIHKVMLYLGSQAFNSESPTLLGTCLKICNLFLFDTNPTNGYDVFYVAL